MGFHFEEAGIPFMMSSINSLYQMSWRDVSSSFI
jgi:hypothetical protein